MEMEMNEERHLSLVKSDEKSREPVITSASEEIDEAGSMAAVMAAIHELEQALSGDDEAEWLPSFHRLTFVMEAALSEQGKRLDTVYEGEKGPTV